MQLLILVFRFFRPKYRDYTDDYTDAIATNHHELEESRAAREALLHRHQ